MSLSHYTTLEAAKAILGNMTLKLSMGAFLAADDPRETKYWHFNVNMNATENHQLFHERSISEQIKQGIGSLSFIRDMKNIPGYYRPRMWAQYAENHRGICIVFNKRALLHCIHEYLDNQGVIYNGNVKYINHSESFRVGELTDITQDDIINENISKFESEIFQESHRTIYLFSKHKDWRDEAEYRIIFRRCAAIECREFCIPCRNAIEKIVFGVDSPDTHEQITRRRLDEDISKRISRYNHTIDICQNQQLNFERIRWTNGIPGQDMLPVTPIAE